MPVRHVIIVALAAMVLLSACSGAGEDTTSASEADGGALAGAPADLDSLVSGSSAYQQDLLEGGLTRAEYEQAALDTERCLTDAGLTVELVLGDPLISLNAGEEWSLGGGTVGTVPSAASTCYSDYLDVVESVYITDNAPSQDELEGQQAVFYQCLRDLGYAVPDNPEQDPSTGAIVDSAEYDQLLGCWEAAGV